MESLNANKGLPKHNLISIKIQHKEPIKGNLTLGQYKGTKLNNPYYIKPNFVSQHLTINNNLGQFGLYIKRIMSPINAKPLFKQQRISVSSPNKPITRPFTAMEKTDKKVDVNNLKPSMHIRRLSNITKDTRPWSPKPTSNFMEINSARSIDIGRIITRHKNVISVSNMMTKLDNYLPEEPKLDLNNEDKKIRGLFRVKTVGLNKKRVTFKDGTNQDDDSLDVSGIDTLDKMDFF